MWNDEQVHDETNRYLQALEEDMGIDVKDTQFFPSDSDDELIGKLAKIHDDMMRRLRALDDISSPPPAPPSLHSYRKWLANGDFQSPPSSPEPPLPPPPQTSSGRESPIQPTSPLALAPESCSSPPSAPPVRPLLQPSPSPPRLSSPRHHLSPSSEDSEITPCSRYRLRQRYQNLNATRRCRRRHLF